MSEQVNNPVSGETSAQLSCRAGEEPARLSQLRNQPGLVDSESAWLSQYWSDLVTSGKLPPWHRRGLF